MKTIAGEFVLETWDEIYDVEHRGRDIEFHLNFGGKKYYGIAVTAEAIVEFMNRNERGGENANGAYFWASGFIVVKNTKIDTIVSVINHIIENNRPIDRIFDSIES